VQLRNVQREARGSVKLALCLGAARCKLQTVGSGRAKRVSRCGQTRVMAEALSLLSDDTRCCIFDRECMPRLVDCSRTRPIQNCDWSFPGRDQSAIASIRAPRTARLQPKNATNWWSKKYQGAFGDIWGSGQNARVLATSPARDNSHLASKQGRPRTDLGYRVIDDLPTNNGEVR
jgi:hypothetical protein